MKRLFQIFVLLTLVFVPLGASQPARASTTPFDRPDIGRNFPGLQDEPKVSLIVSPSSVHVDGSANVTVRLNHVPAEGYASAELTCYFSSHFVDPRNIVIADRFGSDPAVAISNHVDRFIVAIAGSNGNKATTDGDVLTFDIKARYPGQALLECQARVSKGDNVLTQIASVAQNVTILAATVTPTIRPVSCDKAEFIADINVPPGTVMSPGAQFTKTWRLKNVGSCTWTTSYRLVFFSGEQMRAPASIQFPVNVPPGVSVDVSLSLTAPLATGPYRGYWILQNSMGQLFGIGPQGNQPWFVDIVVAGGTVIPTQSPTASPPTATQSLTPTITPGGSTVTPLPGGVYDFVANACAATWFGATAGILPCPGVDGDPHGFVLKLSNPKLESGVIDTRPGLLTFPQNIQNGYIQGVYPPFHVQNGDRFRSTIGCEGGAMSCYVGFRLDYQIGTDPVKTYWGPFLERYDGNSYSINVDLSPLAGQDVKFILTVLSAGTATGDRALWVAPIISRANAGSTSTSETPSPATPTSTATVSDWLTLTNAKYGFRFKYPAQGQIIAGSNDTRTRIDLPVTTGTNLREKFLEVVVAENVNRCESPMPSPQSSELITINGISFLKQAGETRAAGNTYKWTAYSTSRDQTCVSFDFVLHSIDPSIFVTPPPILYNEESESAIFGQIVSTYEWFEITATITPFVPTPTFTITPLSATPEFQFGLLIGQVVASKSVHVSLFDATTHQLVSAAEANSDGTYLISAPAGIPFTIVAKADGFLSIQGFAMIMADRTTTMPRVNLPAGDLDGNNVIDQSDALTIGMNYNMTSPSVADLNNDGIINVLDLELLAQNYRKTGPVSWDGS